ncbi:MAG: NAD(P)/FAD-dependent oxidoreductase [Solirubrobacteraceae bacterium]
MSSPADAVVIGAGHNGLAAAVVLAKAGWKVTVLEQGERPGGAVRTAEVTLPGFRHDLYATNLNIFVGGAFFAEHKDDLFRHGFGIAGAARPFASVFPEGKWAGVSTDPEEMLASIRAHSAADAEAWTRLGEWFGRVAPTLFGVLGAPMPSRAMAQAVWGQRGVVRSQWRDLARLALLSPRELVEEQFESPEVQTLMATWGMHLDFSPDIPGGAVFALLETFVAAGHGMALGAGGAGTLIDALVGLLREHGGEVLTGARATSITVSGDRATGVTTADGRTFDAARAVIANTGPGALTQMVGGAMPADFRRRAGAYRYGPGTFMIHLAVDDLPEWHAGLQLREYAYVHVAPYLGDLSIAYAQACAGTLPQRPLIVVGQPTAVDPTRAPEGKHILWVQVRTVPGTILADATDEITTTDWDVAKEPFADRVLALLEPYAPGLATKVLGRHVISPTDLERANPNLVGGDHLGGSHHPAQHFLFRPVPGWSRYRTPIESLYLCGAATWPGAGVGAGSGHLLGKQLTAPRRRPRPAWLAKSFR